MPKPVACSDDVGEMERVTDTSHSETSKRRLGESLLIDGVLVLCSCPIVLHNSCFLCKANMKAGKGWALCHATSPPTQSAMPRM